MVITIATGQSKNLIPDFLVEKLFINDFQNVSNVQDMKLFS